MSEPEAPKDSAIHQRKARKLQALLREKDEKGLRKFFPGIGNGVQRAHLLLAEAERVLPTAFLRLLAGEFSQWAGEELADLEELGGLWMDLECFFESEQCFRRVLVKDPARLNSLVALANCLLLNSRLTEGRTFLEAALALSPLNPTVLSELGEVLLMQNEPEEALAAFQLAEEHGGARSQSYGLQFVRALAYLPDVTAEDLREAGQEWEARYCPPVAKQTNVSRRAPEELGRPIRLGYYSPDFRNHSVSYFLRGLFREQDQEKFEVFLYSDTRFTDSVTDELRSYADHWRDLVRLDDKEAVKTIKADQLDLFIDLAGYFGATRPQLFASRPAPVQAHFQGYNGTTGLSSLDYRVSDPVCDPPDCDHQSSEKVIRMDPGFHCFEPEPGLSVPEGEAPCSLVPHVTFGSFNATPKLNDEVVETWCEILREAPGSRLLIKSIVLGDLQCREEMVERFTTRGIAENRLDVLPGSATKEDHLASYRRVDIALDSFPVNGTTTTCEALWMGVPVLALLGERHSARVTASLLYQIGFPEGVALDRESYIKQAVQWAGERDQIVSWRKSLRCQLLDSPLGRAQDFARKFEKACLQMLT